MIFYGFPNNVYIYIYIRIFIYTYYISIESCRWKCVVRKRHKCLLYQLDMSLDFNVHSSTPCMFWICLTCVQTHHSFQKTAIEKSVHIFLVLKWILYPWINETGCWKVCNILPIYWYTYIYIYRTVHENLSKQINSIKFLPIFNRLMFRVKTLYIEIVCLYTII